MQSASEREEELSAGSTSNHVTVHLTTIEIMKKLVATMPKLSRQDKPTAMMLAANCHVAALKASDIQ
jgi:hypothetical protein